MKSIILISILSFTNCHQCDALGDKDPFRIFYSPKKPVIPLDTPVQNLNYNEPWKHLTQEERNYAYFMSKASWAGAKIVMH